MKKKLLLILACGLFSASIIAQPANDECSTAQNIGTLPTPAACPSGAGSSINITGTLTGATPGNPYIYMPNCSGAASSTASPANDVWYTVTASGYQATFTINSSFANPNIAFYSGTCANLGGGVGGCAVGSGGNVTLNVDQLIPGTTYYIQVSGGDVSEVGSFTLTASNDISCTNCLLSSSLTVNPTPTNGAYQPGQTVNFCYHIAQYQQSNTNWLHGVQMNFGSGWNLGSLTTTPSPSYSGDGGYWAYYPSGITDAQGNSWPAGFYYETSAGQGSIDGNPGNNYGDDAGSGTGVATIPSTAWNFCFSITVASSCNPGSDLSVVINTSGDGESGIWTNNGCTSDPDYTFNAIGSCCPPNMTSTPASCTNNDGSATATPIGSNGPYDYSWQGPSGYTSSSTGVAGANTISNIAQGNYTVTITDASLCAVTATVTVGGNPVIPPAPTTSPVSYCLNATASQLTATPSTGGTLIWYGTSATGGTPSGTAPTPSTTAAGSTTYYVSQMLNGCEGPRAPLVVTINPLPTPTANNTGPYCAGATISLSASGGTGFVWSGPNSFTSNTQNPTIASSTTAMTGTYNVTVTDANGCQASTSTNVTVNPVPVLSPVTSQTVCANANTTAINFTSNPVGASVNWTNSNGSIGIGTSGNGNIAAFTGTNTGNALLTGNFTATPSLNGCVGNPINFTISVNPIPVLTAVPDQTICAGASTTAINFNSSVTGTNVAWTNTNGTIGIGTSGSGNIAAFSGTNTGSTGVTGNFSATPTANGCPGSPITFNITVNPIPVLTAVPDQTLCAGNNTTAITFNSPVTGTTVAWTNTNGSIGIGTSGSGNIASFTVTNPGGSGITGNFSATPSANGCTGTPITFNINVNPGPILTAVPDQTICAGASTTAINFNSTATGTNVSWTNTNGTIGIGASGTGNIAAFTGTNTGNSGATSTFSATPSANGCIGPPITFNITVNPIPVLTAVPDQTICAGASTTAINFNSPVTGTTVAWTNTNGSIGVGTSGNGNIASFTGTNTGSAGITGNFSATPTANSCIGSPITFNITVNPIPVLTAVPDQTICAGASTAAINFNSTVTSTNVAWTNTNGTIGVGASGSGNISAFTGTNTGSTGATGNFSATPTANGCPGSLITFNITVNPIPVLTAVPDQTICAGASTTAINFNSPVTGTTVAWTNTNGSIGVGTSGSGNIASFTGTNTGSAGVTGNFSATPTANSCVGSPITFNITVNPIPVLTSVPDQTICAGATTAAINFNSTVTSTNVAWTNTNGTIGVGASGSGNISAFTGTNTGSAGVTGNFSATPTANSCVGSPITFNITVNPIPVLTAVPDQTICAGASTTAINFNSPVTGTTVAWTNTNGSIGVGTSGSGNIASFTGTNTGSAGITGNFSATPTANSCVGSPITFNITVNPLPIPTAGNNGTSFCPSDTVKLSCTPGGMAIYTWTGPNNFSSGLQNPVINPTLSTDMSGTYNLTVIDVNGCTGSSSTNITVHPVPTITAGNNGPLCVGQTLNLTSSGGTTYLWSGQNQQYSSSLQNPVITNVTLNDGGSYIVIVHDVFGCVAIATTNVTINANPTPVAVSNGPVCAGTSLDFSTTQNYASYTWLGPNTFASNSASPSVNPASVNYSGTYSLSVVDNNGCQGSITIDVVVNPLPTATIQPVQPGCAPICRDIVLTSSDQLTNYSWNLGNGTYSGNDTIIQHCYTEAGSYNISATITDNNNCTNAVSPTIVTVYSVPVADFSYSPNPVSILQPTVYFTNQTLGSGITSYSWQFGDPGDNSSTEENPAFTYPAIGYYNVMLAVEDSHFCVDTIVHQVYVQEDWSIYVPNAFSPNDDGVNDFFFPKGVGLDEETFQMWIFDRWGNQIFYTHDWNMHWDGKVQGHDNLVQQDTYIWKISVKSFKGDKFNDVGPVTVVR